MPLRLQGLALALDLRTGPASYTPPDPAADRASCDEYQYYSSEPERGLPEPTYRLCVLGIGEVGVRGGTISAAAAIGDDVRNYLQALGDVGNEFRRRFRPRCHFYIDVGFYSSGEMKLRE
jgi:hypothetical protein